MPSVPALFKATLSLKCLSFQFITIGRIALPAQHQNQLLIIVLAKTYNGKLEPVPMPLTPGFAYNEVLIYRLTIDGMEIGELLRIVINYQEEDYEPLSENNDE